MTTFEICMLTMGASSVAVSYFPTDSQFQRTVNIASHTFGCMVLGLILAEIITPWVVPLFVLAGLIIPFMLGWHKGFIVSESTDEKPTDEKKD